MSTVQPETATVPERDTGPEPCPRCGAAAMLWIQSSYQCPACKYKEGCCS